MGNAEGNIKTKPHPQQFTTNAREIKINSSALYRMQYSRKSHIPYSNSNLINQRIAIQLNLLKT